MACQLAEATSTGWTEPWHSLAGHMSYGMHVLLCAFPAQLSKTALGVCRPPASRHLQALKHTQLATLQRRSAPAASAAAGMGMPQ